MANSDLKSQKKVAESIEKADEGRENSGKMHRKKSKSMVITLLDPDGVYRDYTVKNVIFQWDPDCKIDLSSHLKKKAKQKRS